MRCDDQLARIDPKTDIDILHGTILLDLRHSMCTSSRSKYDGKEWVHIPRTHQANLLHVFIPGKLYEYHPLVFFKTGNYMRNAKQATGVIARTTMITGTA